MYYIKEKGFISLIGLLLAIVLFVFLFLKMYPSKKSDTKSEVDTYQNSIEEAENIKGILETKNLETY